jgi:PAS domain S-box-containing protein
MSARPAPGGPAPRAPRRGGNADYFRILADFAPVMIWLAAPDRRCVYFNPRWLEFTGRPLEAELGEGWMEGLHPDDRESCAAAYAAAFEALQPFEIEFRLRRRDGDYRWLLGKGVPLLFEGELSGFVGSCLDITDRLLAEREARRREQDFKRLAENIPDVIVRVDRELRCRYVNPAIEHAFGLRADDLIGRRATEAGMPAPIVEALMGAVRRAFDTRTEQRFNAESDASGARRHFAGRAIPEADGGGEIGAVLVIAYDETARAREDERRAELLARERSARASAESAALARDQFLAIVSHELRSPLNGITSWAHVLENSLREADPGVKRALAGIMTGVEHQVSLIEDLLDMTRALGGNLSLARQPMALLPVLADTVETLRGAALEKDVRIEGDFAIGEREVEGDHDRVRQVFVNLVSHAIQCARAGGVVRVAARAEGRLGCIEVSHDGAGIAADALPHVFDPFGQPERAAGRHRGGLGLRLALAQRLAELHGGHVTCESEGIDRGATFRVFLPLLPQASAAIATGAAVRSASALPSLAAIRVIVIDELRESRESMAALLLQAGARVFGAASADEAIARLETSGADGADEVIVCDVAIPGDEGYMPLQRVRAWEQARGALRRPAIALSAFTQREDRIRALAHGFQVHLTKPVAPAELILVIASIAHGVRV